MKRFLLQTVTTLALMAVSGSAWAAPGTEHLNWGSHITPARCPDDGYRYLEINVTHKVTEDGDSGFTRYWAYLDDNRHIQVWSIGIAPGGDERFCALVRYQGSWISTAGPSPMGTDPSIAAGIDGTFEGGYRAVITGQMKEPPSYRTRGNIGSFDYNWTGNPVVGR